ncbi:MAG: plasmid partitioning protein RepB [Rhizobiales bacterium PAR1]|nr:MAG: plasmid partitioning protein RepB [Rhizobiales bacterium PAR1]
MNKRTDRIRSLFAQQPPDMLSADNKASEIVRVASGSVKAVKDTLSGIERENEELRQRLAGQAAIVEIDTVLIVPSPVADRFVSDKDASYETLKNSIQSHGQEVPVLLRPHPTDAGRFQISYGHRRVRAARELGIPVKATVRDLSDDQLVVAQGLENAAREDLSFIERALFAFRLENQGFSRNVIQDALAIDRAEVSKLISVARAIPARIAEAIGKAPRIGRGRWLEFVEAIGSPSARQRVNEIIEEKTFRVRSSDDRFALLLAAVLSPKSDVMVSALPIKTTDGRVIAAFKVTSRGSALHFSADAPPGFRDFLAEQLPQLFDAYAALAKAKT